MVLRFAGGTKRGGGDQQCFWVFVTMRASLKGLVHESLRKQSLPRIFTHMHRHLMTAVLAVAGLVIPATGNTITVCLGGSCDHSDIQEAINAASDGDVIEIAAETFLPTEAIDTFGKAVVLRGSVDKAGNPTTTIDGQDSIGLFRCTSGEQSGTVLQNLRITGGRSDPGGGMYCSDSSPALINCVFEENSSFIFGGGMYCIRSSPILTNCVFRGNSASINGGAIYCFDSSAILNDCVLEENLSGIFGGGLYSAARSSTTLMDTIICANTPDQISGPTSDGGNNCIRELCIDCEPPTCPADLSGNGVIDGEDLGLLILQWGACGTKCTADLGGNGQVDGEDLGLLFAAWGLCD